MNYYLKQRQYAKKSVCACSSFEFQSWSCPVLWTGGRLLWRPALLLFLAHQQVLTTVVLLPDPRWKQAEWFSPGYSQGSNLRAPSGGQMVTPAFWGTVTLSWNGILWVPGSPSALKLWPCVWQLIEDYTVETGHWDGEDSKPFWNWLPEKNRSKEYFQTGDSGSWTHPRVCSPEGDVINEWCVREHGSHFEISRQNLSHLSVWTWSLLCLTANKNAS